MDDPRTLLLIFSLCDPLGGEGGEGAESGTTSPYGVVSISGGDDVDNILCWADIVELGFNSIRHVGVESRTTREDNVFVEFKSDIVITFLDGFVGNGDDTFIFRTFLDQLRFEHTLRGLESGEVYGD